MNQDQYLEMLRQYLYELPKSQVDKIIQEYREHFQVEMSKGKSPEEIARKLDHPRIIARRYIENSDIPRTRAIKSRSFLVGIARAAIVLIVAMAVIVAISYLFFS